MRKLNKTIHGRGVPEPAPIADTVKTTTCYMCACRCGIRVHLNGRPASATSTATPTTRSTRACICAKGAAGIMQHYSPARLPQAAAARRPARQRRVRARSNGTRRLSIATDWLAAIRGRDPRKLAFFTGRDQMQALTGWWAQQFGTPNYAAHGGFCSVNMAAAGLYTIGGSFWEFGEPDWEHARYFMMFGVAEDHDSQSDQARSRQAQGARRQDRLGQSGAHRLRARSPTNGSASARAPTGCSCSR